MARSSSNDPIDKFRFIVTIFAPSKALVAINATSSLVTGGDIALGRAGFSMATLPEAKVSTMKYRENIDGLSPRKLAGLTEYEPIVFKRGAFQDTQLFNLFVDTNEEASSLNSFNTALASGLGGLSFQNSRYRKDLLLSSLDRAGNFTKHWYISNAFVSGYKGGNDLDAQADEKLIEEITFDYEFFIEVLGDSIEAALNNVSNLAAVAAEKEAASKATSVVSGIAGALLPF